MVVGTKLFVSVSTGAITGGSVVVVGFSVVLGCSVVVGVGWLVVLAGILDGVLDEASAVVADPSVEDSNGTTAPLVGVGTADELPGVPEAGTVGTLGLIIVRVLEPETVVNWERLDGGLMEGTVAPEMDGVGIAGMLVGKIPPSKSELEAVEFD